MKHPSAVLIPSGPVHLACILTGGGALTAALVAYDLYGGVLEGPPLLLGVVAVLLFPMIWGLWYLQRWAWGGAIGLLGILWFVSMQQEIWGGIFFSLAVIGYLVWVRELFEE